jgi:nitrite reductase (NADH) small subunit
LEDNPKKNMAAYKIAKSADVPNYGFAIIAISNGKEIIVFRRDGTLYAMDRFCPHQGAPLDYDPLYFK